MKRNLHLLFVPLFCCLAITNNLNAQQKSLSIHFTTPKQMALGESLKLNVQVKHQIPKEKTGHLQLSLFNTETNQSVDGWFLNFFPFQYFTTIANETFETEFPFTVPNDFKGKFTIELVAKVDSIQDSIRVTIPTFIKQ